MPIKLKNLNDYSRYPEVVEDGKTFEENARKKALAYFKYSGVPTFADDSGLVVPALNGEPGVFSARYAGENLFAPFVMSMKIMKKLFPAAVQELF